MRSVLAHVGMRFADSVAYSTMGEAKHVAALEAAKVDGLFGYLGSITPARVGYVLDAGMAFLPVTYAGEYQDGAADELERLHRLGVPAHADPLVPVFVDLEGPRSLPNVIPTDEFFAMINERWARPMNAAGYRASIYLGVPQPFTSDEMWRLKVSCYWKGMGSVRDRFNELAEPWGKAGPPHARGWSVHQLFDTVTIGGITFDLNSVQRDYRREPAGRVRAMKVVDARSGRTLRFGETARYHDGSYTQLLAVEPGLLSARARLRRRYPRRYHTGRHDDRGFVDDVVVVPLTVRFTHPSYFLQHVAFIES